MNNFDEKLSYEQIRIDFANAQRSEEKVVKILCGLR